MNVERKPDVTKMKTAGADRRHEMVALLVIFTIVGCLVVDSIVLSVRERRSVMAGERKLAGVEVWYLHRMAASRLRRMKRVPVRWTGKKWTR